MQLSVKAVKGFMGLEGRGFNATLYADDVKVAHVIDDASGGQIHFDWNGATAEVRKQNENAVASFIAALPPEALPADAEDWEKSLYPDGFRKIGLDEYVSKLVDDFENAKRMNSQKKTSVLYTTPGCKAGQYFTVKHRGNVEATIAWVRNKHPDCTFL